MNFSALLFLPLIAIFTVPSLQAEKVSRFANFTGTYSEHGSLSISDGNNAHATGTAYLIFKLSLNGTGRLRIVGTIDVEDGTRSFASLYTFRLRNKAGVRAVKFSDLAPAVENGLQGKGTYIVTSRTIRARVPFEIADATGTATLVARLKSHTSGIQLLVTQTLTASTLDHPIKWRFTGRSK